jgi:hypothetical protein
LFGLSASVTIKGMVDVEALAERAFRESWSWGRLAEELLAVTPGLEPRGLPQRLDRVAREHARLGPLEATRTTVRAALAEASRAA